MRGVVRRRRTGVCYFIREKQNYKYLLGHNKIDSNKVTIMFANYGLRRGSGYYDFKVLENFCFVYDFQSKKRYEKLLEYIEVDDFTDREIYINLIFDNDFYDNSPQDIFLDRKTFELSNCWVLFPLI